MAELAGFCAHSGLRAQLAKVAVRDENLFQGTYPRIDQVRIKPLTETEGTGLA